MKLYEILALLWIAAVVSVLHSGCAAGPQIVPIVTPQTTSIHFDASDGGTISVGGDFWLDTQGNVKPQTTGNDIDADHIGNPDVSVSPVPSVPTP